MSFIVLSIFAYVTYFVGTNAGQTKTCLEPWRLEQSTFKPKFVSFNNKTFPGNSMLLSWNWAGAKGSGEWETTLQYYNTGKIMGSMTFRAEKNVANSLIWKYEKNNLSWVSTQNKLFEYNWTMKACNFIWNFCTNDTGDWTFYLGDYNLKGTAGSIPNIQKLLFSNPTQFIRSNRRKRYFPRKIVGNYTANGDKAWEIVIDILDRVFGSSDTLREEGWISHITNLLYLAASALSGVASNGANYKARNTHTPIPRDVETFDPNYFARNNNSGNRLRFSKKG